jgi:hypothetical protein
MTDILVRPAATAPQITQSSRHRAVLAALPWSVPVVALVAALLVTGTPARDIAVYAVYLVVAVAVPGTLVHRALRGSRGNLPEDIGLGAATGLLLQLLGWLLAAATGAQQLLRFWPLVIIALFLAVPKLRRHWRIADPRMLPLRWSWLIAGTMVILVVWGASSWVNAPLPPVSTVYYQDLMYHLALVHEMTRSLPFQVPQIAGDTLRYHYLSDADMAIASMTTGVAPTTVLLRLWAVPIGAIAVLVVAVLGRDLTGRWWAGPLAGAGAFAAGPLALGSPTAATGGGSLSYASPSQTYAMPLLGLLVVITADVLRGRPLRLVWVMVFPLALACAGAKESSVPPFVAGLILAGLILGLRHRRIPWAVAGVLGSTLVAMAIGLRLFAGGGAGTLGLQPLSVLRWMSPYSETLGVHDGIAIGGLLPGGVAHAGVAGGWFIAGLIAWWFIMQTPRLVGLAGLIAGPNRFDPVMWLLGGMIVAGVGASWLLWHPSASQIYFLLCALPFGVLLTVRLLGDHVRRWQVPVFGLLAGALWVLVAPKVASPVKKTMHGWTWALALPILRTVAIVVAVALVMLAVAFVVRRLRPARPAAGDWTRPEARAWVRRIAVALVAAALGGSIASGVTVWSTAIWRQYQKHVAPVASAQAPTAPAAPTARNVTVAEMQAALWLNAHAGNNDVVATNVHCVPIGRSKPCDARAFWVAGLGGRRTVIESWGYSDATVAANGKNGLKYPLQPAPDPARYALNERVFTNGDPADLAQLRSLYKVKWLFADSRAGTVSPQLATLATIKFTSGPVTIYAV